MSIKTERLLSRPKKFAKKGEINEAQNIYESIIKSSQNNSEAKK